MINLWGYDVEVLPNFFSITFVNYKSYKEAFNDCYEINKKGKKKAIPLTDKLSIQEIKKRINNINTKKFYITDTNDNQLMQLAGFINNLNSYKNESGKVIANHCFGYNTNNYDRLMVACFLMYIGICKTSKDLIEELYDTSKKIISLQDNPDMSKRDYYLDNLRKYPLPFVNVDIMTIFALNKVGKGEDSEGNTIYFGKSLKQTSINLKWYELLDYELPDICEKDYHLYTTEPRYKNFTIEELNSIINKWDRYMIDEYIEPTMHYNTNDVLIVCEMMRLFSDEINLRYALSKTYEIDFLSSSRSNIADKLFSKFYSEFSNLQESQWRGKKTERTVMSFKKVIFDKIKFKTPYMQQILEEMKRVSITSIGKDAFTKNITINKLTYTIATGGLHSIDPPRELKSKLIANDSSTGGVDLSKDIWPQITDDSYVYIHYDID